MIAVNCCCCWQLLVAETKIACPSVKNKKRSCALRSGTQPRPFFLCFLPPKIVTFWIYFCRTSSTKCPSQWQIYFFVLVWIIPLQFNLRRLILRNNREPQETHIVLTFYPASFFLLFFVGSIELLLLGTRVSPFLLLVVIFAVNCCRESVVHCSLAEQKESKVKV